MEEPFENPERLKTLEGFLGPLGTFEQTWPWERLYKSWEFWESCPRRPGKSGNWREPGNFREDQEKSGIVWEDSRNSWKLITRRKKFGKRGSTLALGFSEGLGIVRKRKVGG